MNFKIKSIREKQVLDITNAVEDLSLETTLFEQPGKASFSVLDSSDYPRGSIITIETEEYKVFYGYVFEASVTQDNKTQIVAYDQMRYLKNQDTVYFEGKTADQAFLQLCEKNLVKGKVLTSTGFVCLPYRHENASMFSIIKHMQDETLRNTNRLYIIRDNYGVIEFADVASLKTGLVIGEKSLMTDFDYTKSIDEDTYNVVKLSRDNKDTAKRDVWQTQDGDNVKRWGLLQYHDTVDENANEAQIKALASTILLLKNRETRKLSFSAIGFYNLRAGDGIRVSLPGLIEEWFFISSITTSIKQDYVTMDIEVFIP